MRSRIALAAALVALSAVDQLLRQIAAEPRTVPSAPAYPDKSR